MLAKRIACFWWTCTAASLVVVDSFSYQHSSKTSAISSTAAALSARSNNPVAGELTNTLARLDGLWRKQQSPMSRWNRLSIGPMEDEIVYLLEPPFHSVPSCVIVFTGGAGLGTYPQVAYSEFLVRISNQLNAAVITVPYPVGLDHTKIAERNGNLMKRALNLVNTRLDYGRHKLATYCLAHSLGCKLACIDASSIPKQVDADGYGFISFNNFGFDQTFKMAKRFGETLRVRTGLGRNMEHEMLVDSFFSIAETAVRLSRVDFQPSPQSMLRILERRWNSQHHASTRNTRLFTFDDDTMDSSRDFFSSSGGVDVSALPGTHLTPVYFDLRHDALKDYFRVSPRHRNIVPSPSFGDEIALQSLVQEVCSWIHGHEPSRVPEWAKRRRDVRRIQISMGVEENSAVLVRQ